MECKYIKSTGALVATIELIDTLWNVNLLKSFESYLATV